MVHLQLMCSDSLRLVEDWLYALANGLLKITHRQWLYPNEVVHGLMDDGLEREEQQNIFLEIVKQLEISVSGLHEDDAHLMNMDLETLWSQDEIKKKYWLKAIASARQAKLVLDRLS